MRQQALLAAYAQLCFGSMIHMIFFLVLNQQLMSQVNDLLCWCPRFMSQEVGKKTMATSANAKPLC